MTSSYSKVKPTHESTLASTIASNGFVFLKRWHANLSSEEILTRTGRAQAFRNASPVHRLLPQTDATPNTYSGIYGLKDFPFHSDMAHWRTPPRYLMLRCIKGHESVVTSVADGHEIVSHVGDVQLARALVKPRRPLNGAIPLLSLYRPQCGERPSLLRWDEKFIIPASQMGERGMTLLRQALDEVTITSTSLCDQGDTLLIDNWRMLHGRSVVPSEHSDRIIERAYLGEIY